MNAQWNSRLPTSRSTPFSAASAGRSGSARHAEGTAAQHAPRRGDRDGGIGGHRPFLVLAEGVDLAGLDRLGRSARTSARVLGTRHATSDTNSRTVISANHHDPNTSKNPARRRKEPNTSWSTRYSATRWGEFGCCGISEPTTEASASMSSRINAVRIERSVRHTRATDCRSVMPGIDMGRGVPILEVTRYNAQPEPLGERRHEPGELAGEQQHTDGDQERARDGGDRRVVALDPAERAHEPR